MNIDRFIQELVAILSEKGAEIGSNDNPKKPS